MNTETFESCEKEEFLDAIPTLPNSDDVIAKYFSGGFLTKDEFRLDTFSILPFSNPRKKLPGRIPNRVFSIWAILKDFVGNDLTHISLPITLNEPLSVLHKYLEGFAYETEMLNIVNTNDPIERLENIAAYFAVTQSSFAYRIYKPFNPLLGETFEFIINKNFFCVCEQVSHHPPVSAFHFETPKIRVRGFIGNGIKFWGTSIDVLLDGNLCYEFLDSNGDVETVVTLDNFPMYSARGIIMGNIWLERHGTVHIVNQTSGHMLDLTFKKRGWFSNRDLNAVEGVVIDRNGRELRNLYGNWTNEIWSCSHEMYKRIKAKPTLSKGQDSKLLCKAIPKLPNSEHYFNMPQFSMALNELREDMNPAPTDTRFRPDIVCLENGELERASLEKHRLEEKQRAARRIREANGDTWTPQWFDLKPDRISNRDEWHFNFKYLEQNFEKCPDIYS